MANESALDRRLPHPFSAALGIVCYLGRVAILASTTFWSGGPALFFVRGRDVPQLDRLLGMGLPSVALVHVGLGSFLSMQAYFGATFVDGIGPVVGVGLIRNLAPLMVGFILAGLVAARYVAEFRGLDLPREELAHLVAPRVAASMSPGRSSRPGDRSSGSGWDGPSPARSWV